MNYELYHHGVKGMKWGVHKKLRSVSQSVSRAGRAVGAANIEERIASVKRTMERNTARSDKRTRSYKVKNAKYDAKLKRLKAMRNCKVSDLSLEDIERGRSAYKTMKNTTISVAVTAASLAAGTISVPASVATKLVGAGLSSVVNSLNVDADTLDV